MKRFLILVCALMMFTSSTVFAYTDAEKKQFYDGFVIGLFGDLPNSLVANGHSRDKANKYTAALKTRLNRKQLEQQTWGCISKYSVAEIKAREKELAIKCFAPWMTNFMNKNADLYNLLR